MWKSAEESLAREIFRKSKASSNGEAIKDVRENSKKATKVRIEVPWGHIAGKWWGPKNTRPILCIHGWQDNIGTFDTLIPLLPSEFGYLAIDLPGHGFSSPFPHGMSYTAYDYLWIIRRIQEIYEWEKISILAHSLGALLTFVYAGLFPDKVDFVIALDALKPKIMPDIVDYLQTMLTNVAIEDERNLDPSEPPSYSFDQLVDRLHIGTYKSVSPDYCPYILSRGVRKSTKYPDKYYFNRDGRLKYFKHLLISQESCLLLARRIDIPYMFIRAEQSVVKFWEEEKYLLEVIEELKKCNPQFVMHQVKGRHHVHLTNPTAISGILSDFIRKHGQNDRKTKSKL
ncbi:probable serine hydrolase [Phlebotomus argentipes]|uniref:probable serine hydrolase n=1 Tax=Phlebotomus argentipes TaxID=94469 RepID=UPI002892F14C|nr:probable serine hydrolase [Phlebotomus argentipes]